MSVPRFSSPAPAGYSNVVKIPPESVLVWTSGQVGIAPDGTVAEGLEAQARLAFQNVGRLLHETHAAWSDVVKLTIYVTAVDDLETVRAVRDEFVDTRTPPTSSLVRVAGLFRDDLLIEVEAVAATSI